MGPARLFAPDVSSAGTLTARLRQHRNSPIRQIRAQTVDAAYPRLRREFRRLGANCAPGQTGPGDGEGGGDSEGEGSRARQTGSGLRARCTSRAVSSVCNGEAYHRCIASRPKGASGLRVSLRSEASPPRSASRTVAAGARSAREVPKPAFLLQQIRILSGLVSHAKIHIRKRGFHSLGGRHLFLDFRPDPLK